jgi:Protein of unknown function (DUF1592)/Protein of unknown function (DUF1588)/Protein of unknown function (DUF1595)
MTRFGDKLTGSKRLGGALVTAAALLVGCKGGVSGMEGAGTGGDGAGTGTGGGSGSGGGSTGALCTDSVTLAPQRIVRITLKQNANAVGSMIDPSLTQTLVTQQGLATADLAFFPPLDSTREGSTIFADRLQQIDNMAVTASKFLTATATSYATVTKCASATDEACAQAYLLALAEKAYRQPLDARQKASLTQVYTDVKTAGGTVQDGVQFGVEAILNSAEYLYRTEIGDVTKMTADGIPLTPYEIASQLSFFLADNLPDQPLLDAAKANQLSTPAQIGAHVTRLLATAPVQANLSFAMFVFFKLNLLDNVVIDPLKVPTTVFNAGVLNAMFNEGTLFLNDTLWNGKVNDLLTGTTTFVNTDLANNIYKIPVPAGATQTNFVKANLPADQRAGMLTLAPFITSRARTDLGSVVSRGLVVDETMMCQIIPPPPDALAAQIAAAKANLGTQTPKQQAAVRDDPGVVCHNCHANFDPYGLVLENYDVVARYRTVDPTYGPVDPTSFLPPALGGGPVANAVDMAHQLAASGAFSTCVTKSVMQYALSTVDSPVDVASCAVAKVHDAFQAGSAQTFASLVQQVAVSKTLAFRSVPKAQDGGN